MKLLWMTTYLRGKVLCYPVYEIVLFYMEIAR